jgi:chaperonin cofactor prefoldin
MDMLEPSFALLRRLTQEDHRSHTENELKLRIEGLELRAQRLEAEKMTLESRLQELTSEKTSLECRLQDIEKATSATELRVLALKKTVLSTTTSNTPDDQTGERAIETV